MKKILIFIIKSIITIAIILIFISLFKNMPKRYKVAKVEAEIARLLAVGKAGTAEISKAIASRFKISKKKAYARVLEAKEKQNAQ